MDLIEMYPAAVNSKVTVTLGVLNADSTIIEVLDGSVLPDAPNLLVLGSDQNAETVKLTAKEGNTLTVERAIQGNAIAWPAGTQIARNFTAKDWDDLVANIATIVAKILGLTAADVGAVPLSDEVTNLTILLTSGKHSICCEINDTDGTKGTPLADGVSNVQKYFVTSYASSASNGMQIAIPSGDSSDVVYIRRLSGDTVKKWTTGYLPLTGGTMEGDLLFDNHEVTTRGANKSFRRENSDGNLIAYYNADPNAAEICSYKDTDNITKFYILNPGYLELKNVLRFVYKKDGTNFGPYNVFGEHNYPAPMSNAGFHNSVYRGKYLGTAVTDAQWTAIENGTFEDLYIGDYWTIGGINYRIAAFDYYYKAGNTSCTTHHVVLVPDTNMYTHVMNDTNITDGAYVGSKMYTEGLTQAKTTITSAFGSAHILNHSQYLQNATTNGVATGGAWYDSTVELMTEQNVHGCKVFGNCINGTAFPNNYTIDKSQYPLFTFRPDMISNRQWFWLRDVASASHFASVDTYGTANYYGASGAAGVRPAFSIC